MNGSGTDIMAVAAGADDPAPELSRSEGRQGQATPLGQLFAETRRPLTSFFLRRTRNVADAEDMTQETYLRFQRAGYPADSVEAKPLLFHIAQNLFADHARRAASQRRNGFGIHPHLDVHTAIDLAAEAPSPETAVADKEQLEAAIAIINGLPPRCRDVFIMSRFHGMPHKEIAARLGISCSSVEKHLARALAETTAILFPGRSAKEREGGR